MGILSDREKRAERIRCLAETGQTVLSIKANLPTGFKNSFEACFLLSVFFREVKTKLAFTAEYRYESDDGAYGLLLTNENGLSVKNACIELERTHPLGRLIDLDVTDKHTDFSRSKMNLPLRQCLLCDAPAVVCMRLQKHTSEEVFREAQRRIECYFATELQRMVASAAAKERNLKHKFGLVEPNFVGAHADMTAEFMERSLQGILPYFSEMFFCGCKAPSLSEGFSHCRAVGQSAEQEMFRLTDGTNTYKGLIFALGCLLYCLGYGWRQGQRTEEVFQSLPKALTGLETEFAGTETAGKKAHREGLKSARDEALCGMPAVEQTYRFLKNRTESDAVLREGLLVALRHCDDTVLWKRCKTTENYRRVKGKILSVSPENEADAQRMTEECTANGYSIGGAADILICALFLKDFAQNFDGAKLCGKEEN